MKKILFVVLTFPIVLVLWGIMSFCAMCAFFLEPIHEIVEGITSEWFNDNQL